MLTQAPLPSWYSLFQVFWKYPFSLDELSAPWCREGEVTGWFSSSAWSLVRVALWRQQEFPSKNITVWIPDFFCNTALTPLRALNSNLIFYPVNDNLEPDFKACRVLAEIHPPDLFILVHYFGCPIPSAPAKEFCSKHNAWLLEDAAHVLRPVSGIGEYGDFIMYSPHKLLPVPDGAVLVVRPGGPGRFNAEKLQHFGPNSEWSKDLTCLLTTKSVKTYPSIWYNSLWLLKRILQKTGIGLTHKVSEFFENGKGDSKTAQFTKPEWSPLGQRLLGTLVGSLADVTRRRQCHQLLWDNLLLEESYLCGLSTLSRPKFREWTPYLAAYTAIDEKASKKNYESLLKRGLPVTTWPDLPPEVCADREKHKNAWRLRHSRFYLPQHQNLRIKDIFKAVGNQSSNKDVRVTEKLELECNEQNSKQWNSLIFRVGQSNLLQSWAYGEAKSKTGVWKVSRIVIRQDKKPVALVQLLEKRFLIFKLFRVNRGPLFLKDLSSEMLESVMKLIIKEFGDWKKGRLLSFAPELPLSGKILALMIKLGYRQFTSNRWESIWIDLFEDQQILRKRLNGKWRNMLNNAERQNLRFEVHIDADNYEWLVNNCDKMMKVRGKFFPVKLYQQLQLEFKAEQPIQIFKVFSKKEPIAGICVFSHGSTATYLFGWNGEVGRRLNANQFILWNAMMLLKQKGIRWFDMGGIDEDKSPGISDFKLGVNGVRYILLGEFIGFK